MLSNIQQKEKRRLRLARMAVNSYFFVNGVVSATFSARLPTVQIRLALSPGQLGLALLGCTFGALLAMNLAARLSSRLGSKGSTTLAALAMCGTLPLVALAPTFPLFLLALLLFGVGSGAMDVGMNLQGTAIEREYGRSILNSFHAQFSGGSLAGAVLGSILAASGIQPEVHFAAVGVAGCVILAWSARFLFSAKQEQHVQKQPARTAHSLQITPTLMLLGVIAFCSFLGVGAMFDWSAVYLSGTLHTGAGLAAAGFTTFLTCMTLGRSVGDWLTVRFGAPVLLRISCFLAAAGLALTLICARVPAALLGLGLVGLGLSVPFPLITSVAGRLTEQKRGSALATVTTWGYLGLIVGPAMTGFIADRVGVRLALAPVGVLCVLAALCAPAAQAARSQPAAVGEET